MKPLGLRARLTLLYSAIFTLLLALTFVSSYFLFKSQLESDLNRELSDRMEALRGYIQFENDVPSLKFNTSDPEATLFVRNATRYFQVSNLETGTVVIQSQEMELLGLSFVPEELQVIDQQSGPTDFKTDSGELRFLDERIVSPSGQKYLLQVGTSLEPVRSALKRFGALSFILIPCAVVFAAVAGWFLAGGALAPIRRIAHAAREIEPANLTSRLPLTGAHDELDQLAMTFNEALGRIENVVGELRQLSGSIAHELRTPLAALRGGAEIALLHSTSIDEVKEVLGSQLEDFDKLSRTIDQLLTLARAESGGIEFRLMPTDLGIMVSEVVDTFSLLASARDVSLEVIPGTNLVATVDPQWMENVLINLLDNAIKYTPPGGHVTIQGRLYANEVRIEVRDSGQGIPPESLPHIFDRFYRADASRNKEVAGVGLGLSFVKWIIEKHGGAVQVVSRVNFGSTFTIRMPRAPVPGIS